MTPVPGLYPLVFQPRFKERVWGGRNLERLFRKPLPPDVPIGESWEISDRPDDVSVVANGPLAGRDLRWLIANHARELLGESQTLGGRFPLLVKILDAREKLSLQVHPPADVAAELGGEPKTELWYVAHAARGADLYVGLRPGITRSELERRLRTGRVTECFHRIVVEEGDAMFLPSGRAHAIGAGNVIFEIQQNSDTTYRVYDWGRLGLDGKPRELHVRQSLESINFHDYAPALLPAVWQDRPNHRWRPLVSDPLFDAELVALRGARPLRVDARRPWVIGVVKGDLKVTAKGEAVDLRPGGFCLLPAGARPAEIRSLTGATFLRAVPGADPRGTPRQRIRSRHIDLV